MSASLRCQTFDCPLAPASRQSTPARALHRACVLLGGAALLAEHLGVAEGDLLRWVHGAEEPPNHVFIAVVDVILLDLDAPRRPS